MGLGLSKVALLIRKEQMIEALAVLSLGKQSILGYRFPVLGVENGNPLQYCCLENPWTEEPGGLQSVGLQIVRHD